MMRGLGLVEDTGELGGVQMRSNEAASADSRGVRGGTLQDQADDRHLLMAPSRAQRVQWLLIRALRRQVVYARPGALDTHTW